MNRSDDLLYILLKLYSMARFDGLPLTVTYRHQFSFTTLTHHRSRSTFLLCTLFHWLCPIPQTIFTSCRSWVKYMASRNWEAGITSRRNLWNWENKSSVGWKWKARRLARGDENGEEEAKFLKFHFILFLFTQPFYVHQEMPFLRRRAYNLHHEIFSLFPAFI